MKALEKSCNPSIYSTSSISIVHECLEVLYHFWRLLDMLI